jgi:hypothetical protein
MATSRPFAYNIGATISGTTQIGNIAIGEGSHPYSENYGGVRWWNGPDEDLGYVIARTQPLGNQPNPDSASASIRFFRSKLKNEQSFLEIVERQFGQSFGTGSVAQEWLNNNGYWTSFLPPQPYLYLEQIATYLRDYMTDFRNPSFYAYRLDGDGTYIDDGGVDMYDGGNFTTPWLKSGVEYTSNDANPGSYPSRINYTNTTSTLVDTDFYYVSLGYEQFGGSQSATFLPLTVLGSRSELGPVGWQVGGNSGADGGGTLASGLVFNGTQSNGFTTYAFYRQTYNTSDPSHCNLFILLGHSNWSSQFGPTFSFARPVSPDSCGGYLYTASASNILSIQTLLSKSGGAQVTAAEISTVVDKFTLRIKESLGF